MNLRMFIGLEPYFQIQDWAFRIWRDLLVAFNCRLRSGRNGGSPVETR